MLSTLSLINWRLCTEQGINHINRPFKNLACVFVVLHLLPPPTSTSPSRHLKLCSIEKGPVFENRNYGN